jgi:single-stranded DNA-binding protein
MTGKNFVELVGLVKWPELTYTANGNARFKCKIAVPFQTKEGETKHEYHAVVSWGALAEDMSSLIEDAQIKIHGRINSRSFMGKCPHCNEEQKRYWTEVVADNFVTE